MYNFEVGTVFCEYLRSCGTQFDHDRREETYERQKLKKLREIYKKLSKVGDVEDYILYLRGIIESYEKFVEEG